MQKNFSFINNRF